MKNHRVFLALAFLVAVQFACVIPNLENSQISTPIPAFTPTNTIVSGRNTENSQQNCQELTNPVALGKVLASPKGGLNLRNLPLDEGGKVLITLKDGDNVEIFISDTGNGWSKVRVEGSICGYVNNKYIKILE